MSTPPTSIPVARKAVTVAIALAIITVVALKELSVYQQKN